MGIINIYCFAADKFKSSSLYANNMVAWIVCAERRQRIVPIDGNIGDKANPPRGIFGPEGVQETETLEVASCHEKRRNDGSVLQPAAHEAAANGPSGFTRRTFFFAITVGIRIG